jgi:hypothetical protein
MTSRPRPRRRARWTTAIATAVALGAAALPSPASAATVTSLSCESGGGYVLCDVVVGGETYGLAPAIRWTVGGVPVPAYNNETTMLRSCRVGARVAVTVWVAAPLSSPEVPFEEDTRTITVLCRRVWQ